MLETSHPPTYYLPAAAFAAGVLRPTHGHTYCEWKGQASYVDLVTAAATAPRAGWTYPEPIAGFEALVGHYRRDARRWSTSAASTASGSCPRRAASTAAGSPAASSAPSRASRLLGW